MRASGTRFPPWLRKRLPGNGKADETSALLADLRRRLGPFMVARDGGYELHDLLLEHLRLELEQTTTAPELAALHRQLTDLAAAAGVRTAVIGGQITDDARARLEPEVRCAALVDRAIDAVEDAPGSGTPYEQWVTRNAERLNLTLLAFDSQADAAQAVIQGRLRQLSPGAREIIRMAAVMGRHFSVELLRAERG